MREWAGLALARQWPAARLERWSALKGDASTRRFWRGFIERVSNAAAPPSVVAVDLGPDDLPLYVRALGLAPLHLPEPPFISVQRLMEQIGIAVPALFAADIPGRRLLVEDVGDLSLYEAVSAQPARAPELYRLAVDELLKLHRHRSAPAGRDCIAYSIAYNRRLFRWEMEQFVEYGIPWIAPGVEGAPLGPELDHLAELLDALPRVLSHRDYHYQNLFLQPEDSAGRIGVRIRVIDFQDALMAPAAQDLAVLLTTRETGSFISPALEAELLDYYFSKAAAQWMDTIDRARFIQSYRWCVLQHALKVIGRFVFLEQSGKPGYRAYLPATIGQARRMLESSDDFPSLRKVMHEL